MILDTNVYIKYCLEPDEKLFELINDNKLVAPDFLKLEIINVLRKLHFFQGLSRLKTEEYESIIFGLVNEFISEKTLLEAAKRISYEFTPLFTIVYF